MKASTALQDRQDRWVAFSVRASELVIALGCGLFCAWIFNLPASSPRLADFLGTHPATAFGLVLAGISLRQLQPEQPGRTRRARLAGWTLAWTAVGVGMAKLTEGIWTAAFQFDRPMFSKMLALPHPSFEMSPASAMSMVLCGLGLVWLDRRTRRGFWPAQGLALVAGLIALLSLIGYSYRLLSVYRVGAAGLMPPAPAIAYALLALGILASRPDQGMMRALTGDSTGGAMGRRLLPMAILIPWALGGLRLMGEEAGYFHTEFGISSFAGTTIVVFTLLIWWYARLLFEADQNRARTERRLAVQYAAIAVLAQAHELEEAMRKILEAVCESLDWEVGAMWKIESGSKKAECVEIWHSPKAPQLEAFAQQMRRSVIYRGEGLPGRVWESGEPMWLEDVVRDRRFSLAEQAAAAGLHATFVFPIRSGEDTCGVMEFFSREIEHPDKSLLQMFSALGAQIGQFIERRRAEEQLRRTTADLQRSNTELQQFAYVASHDLSEPLRMVISYLQLLNEKQQGKLEPQTEEFLRFASEGAHRMQALIKDLLAYSRVDLRGGSFSETNIEQGLKAAMANLTVAIDESRATITHDALPTLRADPIQITQVFQNLIGNAIKFRGTQPPRIHVSAELRQEEWLFSVRDNGIGIEPKNFERIFVIFQRLHTRQEYPGTGMGLAICKRIIERHGGRIWLESQPGQGTVFFLTLPAQKQAPAR